MDAPPPPVPAPGTAELCAAVGEFAEIQEAMVIDAGQRGEDGVRLLFVVMRPGKALDDALRAAITTRLRANGPPPRLPDAIYAVPELPRTADGGIHTAAVRNIFTGASRENAVGPETVANPAALRSFVDLFNNL